MIYYLLLLHVELAEEGVFVYFLLILIVVFARPLRHLELLAALISLRPRRGYPIQPAGPALCKLVEALIIVLVEVFLGHVEVHFLNHHHVLVLIYQGFRVCVNLIYQHLKIEGMLEGLDQLFEGALQLCLERILSVQWLRKEPLLLLDLGPQLSEYLVLLADCVIHTQAVFV